MTRIDLKKSFGFPLYLQENRLYSEDIQPASFVDALVEDMKPQLLNADISSPANFYTKYRQFDHENIILERNLRFNMFLIPGNLAGIEYVKTKASMVRDYPRILEVIHGSGSVIMQGNKKSNEKDIIVTKVKKEQKLIVPGSYAAVIVNTRQAPLIVAEVYSKDASHTNVLDEMQGMSYYIIRKNAKQEIVRNPRYRSIEKFRKINWDTVLNRFNITLKTPIIKQILRKYEKFNWLFEKNSIEI